MKKAWLIPCEGRLVPDLKGNHLPPEGAECELNSYYRRRLTDGDVRKGRKPAPEKTAGGKGGNNQPAKRSGGDDK